MTINITSWKTSLAGLIALFIAAMQTAHSATIMEGLKNPQVQIAVLAGIGLMLSKDYNTTGGTVAATPEAKVRLNGAPKPPAPGASH